MKLAVVLLVLLLAGCSSSPPPAPAPEPEPNPSFLAMVPGDARAFDGPGGELLLIFVDETYFVDGINANALTWELGDDVTSDFFFEDDDGTVWWYGRRGSWRAGQRGQERREVKIVGHRARFGDRVITLSGEDGPVQLETPEGVYTSAG